MIDIFSLLMAWQIVNIITMIMIIINIITTTFSLLMAWQTVKRRTRRRQLLCRSILRETILKKIEK